jgi:hypothetical protein
MEQGGEEGEERWGREERVGRPETRGELIEDSRNASDCGHQDRNLHINHDSHVIQLRTIEQMDSCGEKGERAKAGKRRDRSRGDSAKVPRDTPIKDYLASPL